MIGQKSTERNIYFNGGSSSDLTKIENDIEKIETDISGIDSTISEIENNITTLQSSVIPPDEKTIKNNSGKLTAAWGFNTVNNPITYLPAELNNTNTLNYSYNSAILFSGSSNQINGSYESFITIDNNNTVNNVKGCLVSLGYSCDVLACDNSVLIGDEITTEDSVQNCIIVGTGVSCDVTLKDTLLIGSYNNVNQIDENSKLVVGGGTSTSDRSDLLHLKKNSDNSATLTINGDIVDKNNKNLSHTISTDFTFSESISNISEFTQNNIVIDNQLLLCSWTFKLTFTSVSTQGAFFSSPYGSSLPDDFMILCTLVNTNNSEDTIAIQCEYQSGSKCFFNVGGIPAGTYICSTNFITTVTFN